MSSMEAAPESASTTPSTAWQTPSPRSIWMAAALVALVVTCYLPSLRNGFIWDDDHYVTDNRALTSLRELARIWGKLGATPQYYPLTFSSFWLEYQLWGTWAPGYHAVNIALHATCAMLLWRLLARLAVPGAWLAAAIFAVHPIEVESVAWVTERKNLLSLACALVSMLCYLRFAPPEEDDPSQASDSRRSRYYNFSFLFFVAALLSKSVTASLPAVLLVIRWWKRGRIAWPDVQPLVRFFIAGATMGLFTAWYEKNYVGALGDEWSLGFLDRTLIAGRAVWFYAGKLLWPRPLVFFYPHWEFGGGQGWQWLFVISAGAFLGALWRARAEIGRGPLAAVLVFGGVLVPVLGFLNVYPFRYSFVADHFQYHAGIALIALAAATAAMLFSRSNRPGQFSFLTAAGAVLAALAVVTFQRQAVYRDRISLYTVTIDQNPACWMAYNNLGNVLAVQGRNAEAVPYYEETLRLKPQHMETYNNLALALAALGRKSEALELFERALEIDAKSPDVHNNLAGLLVEMDRASEAIPHLEEALRLNRYLARAHLNLAKAYAKMDQQTKALAAAEKAIEVARLARQPAVARQADEWLRAYSRGR